MTRLQTIWHHIASAICLHTTFPEYRWRNGVPGTDLECYGESCLDCEWKDFYPSPGNPNKDRK